MATYTTSEGVFSWSPGTSATSPSTRFADAEPALAPYGVPRNDVRPPVAGPEFFGRYQFTADKLSVSDTLVTDREWSVGRAGLMIVKGTVEAAPIVAALREEGLYPVLCDLPGEEAPRALASIWVNELHDSVCGAYHEYVISFDVRADRAGVVAFTSGGAPPAYACWYNNFGSEVCEAQLLHSLYIDSPLSIAWGREMQAFPKHPVPVASRLQLDPRQALRSCEIGWDGKPLLRIQTERRFGLGGLLRESAGLLSHLGLRKVAAFLGRPVFSSHILMPVSTAAAAGRPREYTAHIWKGLHPTAVKLWPWDDTRDSLFLSDAVKESGCEENNGVALLRKAGFRPLSVCSIDALSAVVVPRER